MKELLVSTTLRRKAFNPYQMTNFETCLNLKHLKTDKLKETEGLKIVLGKVENIVGKGENAGY